MNALQNKKSFQLKNRLKSFIYAFKGVKFVFLSQHNMWIHIVLAFIAVTLGFVLGINIFEWVAVIFSIGFVLSMEIFNSAIETLVDLTSPNYNEKAGKIKDMAAGAVLISAITTAIIGAIIFIPKILNFLNY
ncbi:MAG: diacylglycerol kinase family protein [Bacteroidetes bacterium]|nr:diacylglycerol kinase family protein [Bacteroidota bacterium]